MCTQMCMCVRSVLSFSQQIYKFLDRRWEDNIKMDVQKVGCGSLDWIEVAQDRDSWRALMNAVMNLPVP